MRRARIPPTTPPTTAPVLVVEVLALVIDAGFVVRVSDVAVAPLLPPPLPEAPDPLEASEALDASEASDADTREASAADDLEAEMEASMTNWGSSRIDVTAVVVPQRNMDRTGVPVQR